MKVILQQDVKGQGKKYSWSLSLCSSNSFSCLRLFFSSVFSSLVEGSGTCSST